MDATAGPHDADGADAPARKLARASRDRAAQLTRDMANRVMRPTLDPLEARLAGMTAALDALKTEHDAVAEDLRGLHNWLDLRFAEVDARDVVDEVHELAKKVEELSTEVRALDRHVRRLADGGGARPAAGAAPRSGPAQAASPPPVADVFDYDAFEQRFRGYPERIFAEQVERYADLLLGHAPVVEMGCGRGGFLAALRDRGVSVVGVEPNADMAALARGQGVEVFEQDAAAYLAGVEDGSLGAVVSFQVVEHLELRDLIALIDLSAQKLQPGGVFIAETPNPASWIVLHTSFLLDPTHVRPLHPALLSFLCERAGFAEVAVEYFAPAETMQLPGLEGDDVPAWARRFNEGIERLNHVLFGPQDYAVVARMPEAG